MANVGQIALDVVGAVLSIYTGNPIYFALAEATGQVLFPTVLPNVSGPRLGDHATTSSTLGDPIVIGYGTFPTAGTVIFLDEVVEHATTTSRGGKGAPKQSQTTYTYTQSIGIGLCETTSMLGVNNPILGIQRIWENGELVYDTRPIQDGETTGSGGGHGEHIEGTYQKRLQANTKYAETFVLYLGTEDQDPDPTIEAQQGVGTTLSYRGLAYIVYPDRLLRSDQGTRHPTFKFEILAAGHTEATIVEPTYLEGANKDLVQVDAIAVDRDNLRYFIWSAGTTDAILGFSLPDNVQFGEFTEPGFATLGGFGMAISPNGELLVTWLTGGSAGHIARVNADTMAIITGSSYDWFASDWTMSATETVNFGSGPQLLIAAVGVLAYVTVTDCVTLIKVAQFHYTDHPNLVVGLKESGNAVFWVASNTPSVFGPTGGDIAIHKIVVTSTGATNTLTHTIAPSDIDPTWGFIQTKGDMILDPTDGHILLRVQTGSGPTQRYYVLKFNGDTGAIDWCTAISLGPNYQMGVNQSRISGNTWMLVDQAPLVSYFSIDLVTGTITVVDLSSVPGIDTFQGTGVTDAGFLGGALLVNMVAAPVGWSLILPNNPVAGDVTIGDIVADLCERSGLTDHDTSSLGDETVEGFVLAATPMTARDAIVPLRSVGFFDGVESGDTMKFIKRGGAPALTLGVDDIGAVESESSDDPPPANSVTIAMESDLPQQIRASYMSPARDYQSGQQLSPVRFDTASQNIVDVQLGGVCITDDQAAQVAEILWNDAWHGDHTFTFAVDQSFAALEPTDVVLVPMQGTLYRVRILTIDDASQVQRTITAMTDDDGNYVSDAVAQEHPVAVTMKFHAESSLILMDAPLLEDANDTGRISAPMYSAVFPNGTDSWIGAGVFRSPDGTTYSNVATATTQADVGTTLTVLDDTDDPFVDDDVNTVQIQMTSASSLPVTITDDQLLDGGNAAAIIDADGAIEIFQFRDVTVDSADTVTLSYLLRGRRGSESMTGNHAIGGRFIMLAPGTIQQENLNLSDLTRTLQWKAVGSDDDIDDVTAVPFAESGRSLKPRAPWNTRTSLAGSDILIMADRRSRIENDSEIAFASPTLPVNEDSESYEIDVYDAPGTSVVRTLSGTSLPMLYAAADIASDFGSTPATLWLAVYQMSGQVGRGFTHLVNVGVPT